MLVERGVRRVVVIEQEHVNEVDEDAGGAPGHGDVKGAPFEDDHEDQVPEQAQDKNHLGDELQHDAEGVSEEYVVEKAENDPKNHLDDSQDDRHFHLIGVQEC